MWGVHCMWAWRCTRVGQLRLLSRHSPSHCYHLKTLSFPPSALSQEVDDDDPAKVEDDAASATEEEDWEEDNERSERRFGYDPDREVDVWAEYQAAMEDPMFAY